MEFAIQEVQESQVSHIPQRVGEIPGLVVMTLCIVSFLVGGIWMIVDYYNERDNGKQNGHLWRPHRSVLAVTLAGAVCCLLLTPLVGMASVLYYKCRYPDEAKQLSYRKGATNAFRATGQCILQLLCIM